jgi:two-component system response regulator
MNSQSEMTIVMVDDNPDEIFLTRRLVRRDGIINNFVSEKKPERLLDTLGELRSVGVEPQKIIVLLDINMPRSDGFETLRRLRSNPEYKDVPVFMLSASDNEADVMEAMSLGANGYLVKPFQGEDFFAALGNTPHVKHRLVPAVC